MKVNVPKSNSISHVRVAHRQSKKGETWIVKLSNSHIYGIYPLKTYRHVFVSYLPITSSFNPNYEPPNVPGIRSIEHNSPDIISPSVVVGLIESNRRIPWCWTIWSITRDFLTAPAITTDEYPTITYYRFPNINLLRCIWCQYVIYEKYSCSSLSIKDCGTCIEHGQQDRLILLSTRASRFPLLVQK